MKFRKKPIVIEAEQYQPILYGTKSFGKILKEALCSKAHDGYKGSIHIHTLEGIYDVQDGDWIIKGVRGEFYPCRSDIFAETYEEVF